MLSSSLLLISLVLTSPQSKPPLSIADPAPAERESVSLLDSTFSLRIADDFEAGAMIRAFWAYSDGDLGNDLNGFTFHDVDIWAEMELDSFEFRVNFDADSGTAELEDAYAKWIRSEALAVSFGQFKPRTTFSTAVDPDRLILNDRTLLGTMFDSWDLGAEVSGNVLEKLDYFVSVTNGSNGVLDDTLLVARGEVNFYGEEVPLQEGNHQVEEQEIIVGATYYSDTGNDEIGFGADALVYWGRFGAHAEFMRFGDGLNGTASLPFLSVSLQNDTSPISLTGWINIDENFQAAARYQMSDNSDEVEVITGGVTFYPEDVPLAVTVDASFFSDMNNDGFALQVGLTMGHWRQRN